MTTQNWKKAVLACTVLLVSTLTHGQTAKPSPQVTHERVTILAARSSPEAKEELLRVALDPNQPMALYAASLYGRKVKGTPEAANLLKASTTRIKQSGLNALYGCSFESSVWELLKRELTSSNATLRGFAALVVAADRGEIPPAQKAEAIVSAMFDLETLPGAQQKSSVQGFEQMKFAASEVTYMDLIQSLVNMKGLTPETLRELTPGKPGNPRDCLMVVRTLLDDDTALSEARRVALDNPLFLIRHHAVTALRHAGRPEDIDTLRKVATQDPTSRTNWVPSRTADGEVVDKERLEFPLRERATKMLQDLDKARKDPDSP
jgi:hypothetical protein